MLALAPISEKEMTYSEAILYCTFCQHDDYTDWRLPTKDEYFAEDEIVTGCWNTGWYNDAMTGRRIVCPVRDI
jgi:hypothetical protein